MSKLGLISAPRFPEILSKAIHLEGSLPYTPNLRYTPSTSLCYINILPLPERNDLSLLESTSSCLSDKGKSARLTRSVHILPNFPHLFASRVAAASVCSCFTSLSYTHSSSRKAYFMKEAHLEAMDKK